VFLAVPAAAVAAAALARDAAVESAIVQAFVVALAGTTAGVLNQLVLTAERLRRTRQQLAHAAVAHERDRVARDLHDVLGHTLSVMVVKAAAARRLAHTDPDAAVAHATDIEDVGRAALGQVRRTIEDVNKLTLADELARAADVLAAGGIKLTPPAVSAPTSGADEPLAWALREGVTNVLRHSGARHCRIDLATEGDTCRLTITDDGIGADARDSGGRGGLEGLRRRLELSGGGLDARASPGGYTLSAWMPHAKAPA
jgi:two-component system sensor histidine kinase DesK